MTVPLPGVRGQWSGEPAASCRISLPILCANNMVSEPCPAPACLPRPPRGASRTLSRPEHQQTAVGLKKQEVTRKAEATAGPREMAEPPQCLRLPAKGITGRGGRERGARLLRTRDGWARRGQGGMAKRVPCVPSPQLGQQRVSKGKRGQESKEKRPLFPPHTSWALPQAPAGCTILGGQLYLPQQAGGLEAAPALCRAKAELCTRRTPSPLCREHRSHSSARAHGTN